MTTRVFSIATACAVLLTSVDASAQQTAPSRPFRGLFGGDDAGAQDGLTVNASIGSGYVSHSIAEWDDTESDGVATSELQTRGSISNMVSGGLGYSRTSSGLSLGASLSGYGQHYPDYSGLILGSFAGSAGASLKLSNRITIGGRQSVSYQPWRVLMLFPALTETPLGQILAANPDFATARSDSYLYSTGADLTYQVGRRDSITASYGYDASDMVAQRQDLTDEGAAVRLNRGAIEAAGSLGERPISEFSGGNLDFRMQNASLTYSRGIATGLGVRLGYRYSEMVYTSEASYRGHVFDAGLDYSRALSLTRRTTLSFSTGATGISHQGTTRYSAVGNATLLRQIGRTWTATASYIRNASFVHSLFEPVFYDAASVGFGGLINRRVSFQTSAGATLGDLGLEQPIAGSNSLDSRYGAAALSFALSRHLALSVDYVYFSYSFGLPQALAEGFSQRLGRHGVRASFSAWAPVFQRRRR